MKAKKFSARLLSLLLAIVMVAGLAPAGTAFAADGDASGQSGVVVDKTATLEDDGTYTINLLAYATGTTSTITEKSGTPLDIVLVIDQSGSMKESNYIEPLKTAVTGFVNAISANAKEYNVTHRIALVGYASDRDDGESDRGTISSGSSESSWINTGLFIDGKLKNYGSSRDNDNTQLTANDYQKALVSVNDANGNVTSSITMAISNIAGSGATRTSYGMEMANKVFENNSLDGSNRKRIVVVFTDGKPGYSSFDNNEANSAIGKAYTTKNTYGATVYTVGLYSNAGNNATNFMNYLSSNYPNAQSMNSTTEYEYTPVYSSDLDTSKTYYVNNNGDYSAVTYSGNMLVTAGWSNGWTKYTPKTSENDNTRDHTQFYERTVKGSTGGPGEKTSDKYYMTTSNSAELGKIFENISQDIQNPSTTVTLNAESVMRDVLGAGFTLPENYDASTNIFIKTVAGSITDGETIAWGAETPSPAGITASVDGSTINVTGFNYSGKYIAPSHPGEKLMVTIRGILPTDAAVTGEAVDTNDAASGIYATADAESCIPFPRPKTILTSKAYVLDYAKEAELSLDQNAGVSAVVDAFKAVANDASVVGTYGNTALADGKVSYTPKTTDWSGYDTFYAFGKTNDETIKAASANANGNLWSKVSVIPATSVYYEDDFITDASAGTVGIVYGGTWTTDGTSSQNTETPDGAVHGWETSLADDTGYSDGSAHKADLSEGGTATATFTFTGTGVDIYSRTNDETGTIYATVKQTVDGTTTTKRYVVDNKAKSGDYYQIPTLTFAGEYGTYEVTIRVTTGAASEGRYTYYLDGIRVYNPIQKLESDSTVAGAYEDKIGAAFTEVRSLLDASSGVAFVDEDENGEPVNKNYADTEISQYAPEHEVYLAAGQSITFKVSKGAEGNGKFYIGLKAPSGSTTANLSANAETAAAAEIEHATDLYYAVEPDTNGNIVITNTGANLLAITKICTTSGGAVGASVTGEEAVAAVTAFSARSVVPYSAEPVETPEEPEPEAPAEPEEPETPDEPGDVVIDNPEQPEDPPAPSVGNSGSWLEKLFGVIRGWFRP